MDLCKPIETYIDARKKHPFASYPTAKHPKHSKFAITDIREKLVNFFYCLTRASTLAPAITLLTQTPLQKFPLLLIFPYKNYTGLSYVDINIMRLVMSKVVIMPAK